MTAKYKEIRDEGPNPNTPTIEEMRDSQERGSKGIGLNEQSYCQDQRDAGADYGDVYNTGRPKDFNHANTAPDTTDESSEYRAGLPFLGRK